MFPDAKHARVLWIGVKTGLEEVKNLFNILEKELSNLGIRKEDREFHPHLTLGRVRSNKNLEKLISDFLNPPEPLYLGKMTVKEVVLFSSKLLPSGAEYTKLKQVSLK